MNEQETTLVEMVLAGNSDAFEPLVRPYRNDLIRLAYRMTGNWEDANEASQETLLRAYRYLARFDTARSFKNWLLGILVNEARKSFRKNPRSVSLAETSEPSTPADQGRRYEEGILRDRLHACLNELSHRQREVFILRDIDDRNIKETARILGASEIAVRVHLSKARKKIKDLMIRDAEPGKETTS